MNKWPKLFLVGVGGVALSVVVVSLLPNSNVNLPAGTPWAEISRAPATEIPAVAAKLVRQAPAESRIVVARQVLEAVQALEKPCALPFVVAEMTKSSPPVGPQAVAVAAELQPAESLAVVQAAVAAAPQMTEDILFEFSQKMPALSFAAAQVAATVAAEQSLAAVMGVGRALPGFAPFVQKAVQNQAAAGQIDVTTTLKQAQEMAAAAAQQEKRMETGRAVSASLAQQPPASPVRVLSGGKVEMPNLSTYAAAELARAQQSANKPAQSTLAAVSASAAFKAPAKAVSPASLKVPSPEQVKSQVDELVRPNIYNRP